jgi:hypothetical protein
MVVRPPVGVQEVAAQNQLGRVDRSFDNHRRPSTPVVGTVVGVAALAATVAGFAGQAAVAIALGPLTLLGIAAYAWLLPPPGGRRWVVLYEHGLIDTRPPATRAVRWDDVSEVEHGPDGTVLTARQGGPDETARVWLGGLGAPDRVAAAVDRHVQPRALARAEADLESTGRAVFGGLIVERDGLRRASDGEALPWQGIAGHYLLDGSRLRVTRATDRTAWFDAGVPNARAADRFVDRHDPTARPAGGGPPDAAPLLDTDLAAQDADAAQRRSRAHRSTAVLAALAVAPALLYPAVASVRPASEDTAAPAARPSATPTAAAPTSGSPTASGPPVLRLPPGTRKDFTGYAAVCKGDSFSGAAAYTGPGPHPIMFFGVGNLTDWRTGHLGILDDAAVQPWYATDVTQVQLVACVDRTDGPRIRGCGTYEGVGGTTVTVTLVWSDYTFTVYEAKTGKPVVQNLRVRGNKNTTCPALVLDDNSTNQQTVRTEITGAQVAEALRRVVG